MLHSDFSILVFNIFNDLVVSRDQMARRHVIPSILAVIFYDRWTIYVVSEYRVRIHVTSKVFMYN